MQKTQGEAIGRSHEAYRSHPRSLHREAAEPSRRLIPTAAFHTSFPGLGERLASRLPRYI